MTHTKLDAHHHFWRFNPAEYDWIGPEQTILRRDYLPADLQATMARAGVNGVVSVEARQRLEETEWLLSLADEYAWIRGVVGWVPLVDAGIAATLEGFSGRGKLRGVRHVLQAEPDEFMEREDFNRGLRELRRWRLVYDILVVERQLPAAIALVDRHPEQVFVLDHVAKPRLRELALEPWRTQIRELARRPNVYCKISGMVTEADHLHWRESQLWPFCDTVVDAFTPQRLMFGSDWPVCLLASTYTRWTDALETWFETLTDAEQARIWSGTAIEVYGLDQVADPVPAEGLRA